MRGKQHGGVLGNVWCSQVGCQQRQLVMMVYVVLGRMGAAMGQNCMWSAVWQHVYQVLDRLVTVVTCL